MNKVRIGITTGDINGIGLEIILKTLSNEKLLNYCCPVVYGSSKVISYHKNIVGVNLQFQTIKTIDRLSAEKVNVFNCWNENVNITLGKPTEESGQFAMNALEVAVNDLKSNNVDALVTAPINKHAMSMGGFGYPGHTEYLTQSFSSSESLMLMINDGLRIGVVTNHLPLNEVVPAISKAKIIDKLNIFNDSLKKDFGIERPTIAVLGLNPHAGDQGTLGVEEEQIIRPAIVEMKKKGMLVMGPYSADAFFGSKQYAKFDGILAMYHDQGLIPFKTLSFGMGVNFTAGLPIIRTSPDHGTAYDIAGKNEADPSSFRRALFAAIDIAKSRKSYIEMHANQVKKHKEELVEAAPEEEVINND